MYGTREASRCWAETIDENVEPDGLDAGAFFAGSGAACDAHGFCRLRNAVFDPVAWATEEVHGKIVRDEDKAKTANTFMPGADFRVIVTSSFSAGDAAGIHESSPFRYPSEFLFWRSASGIQSVFGVGGNVREIN